MAVVGALMGEKYAQTGRRGDRPKGTDVFLIRHGESAPVEIGAPGSDDPPLSPEGEQQAAALAARLRGRRLDAVYTSTMARAIQTGAPLAAERSLTPVARHDLREVDLGEWAEGEFRRRAATADPEFLAFVAAGRWDAIPGAERDEDLRDRMHAALDEIADAHPDGTVAVVSHGGAINAWLTGHHRGPAGLGGGIIDNTSVTHLRRSLGRWQVVGVNDTHHLGDSLL